MIVVLEKRMRDEPRTRALCMTDGDNTQTRYALTLVLHIQYNRHNHTRQVVRVNEKQAQLTE